MFKAIKRNVFVRVLYITRGKFKEKKKKKRERPHTQSHRRREPPTHEGARARRCRPGARGCAGPRGLGGVFSEPSPTPPAIHLQPAAEYDNVSIFHLPDITINKAMIQKGLC